MSTTPRRPTLVVLFLAAALVGSCVGGEDPTAVRIAEMAIALQPALIPSAADGAALPVNRIRTVVARQPDGVVLREQRFTVSPTDASWTLEVGVPVSGETVEVVVYLYLLNVDDAGVETVQFSGRTDPITVESGARLTNIDADVVRGPPTNLLVTSVSVTSAPSSLAVGSSATLSASVETSAPTTAQLFWTSLDPAVLTMADSVATGVSAGTAQVVASAGAHADTVSIAVVVPAVDSVRVSPDSADVAMGQTRQYLASLFDVNGAPISRPVTWTTGNSGIATVNGSGVVTGVATGTTTVRATSEGVFDQAVVRVTASAPTGGARNAWNGGAGNWSDPAMWSLNRVPGSADTVHITQGAEYTVTLDASVTVAALWIEGAITLDIVNSTLTLGGTGAGAELEVRENARVQLTAGATASSSIIARGVRNLGVVQSTGFANIQVDSILNHGEWRVQEGLQMLGFASPVWMQTERTLFVGASGILQFGPNANLNYQEGTIEGGGTLALTQGATLTLGQDLTIDAVALILSGASILDEDSEDLTVGPNGFLEIFAPTEPVDVRVSQILVEGEMFVIGNTRLPGTLDIAEGGTFFASSEDGPAVIETGDVQNAGTLALVGTSEVIFGPGSLGLITNSGTLTTTVGGFYVLNGQLNNLGDVTLGGVTRLIREDANQNRVLAQHVNAASGTIEMLVEGDLIVELGGTGAQPPRFTNSGRITVGQGTELAVENYSSPTPGQIIANVGGILEGDGTVDLTFGTPSLTGVNNGTIAPGEFGPGILTWTGTVPMGPTGNIAIEIFGPTAGTGHDRVDISAQLNHDVLAANQGRLDLVWSYSPFMGDRFPIISYGTRLGSFSTVNLNDPPGVTLELQTVTTASPTVPDTLVVVVTQGPTPPLMDVWTWIKGDSIGNQYGVYGSLGVTSPTNAPGSREDPVVWSSGDGTAWMYGGVGYGAAGLTGNLDDLWYFDGTDWTWIDGGTGSGQAPIYGTQGVPAPGNTPGGRRGAFSWLDANGDLWLFGGGTPQGPRNDLWRYDGTDWAWISGPQTASGFGVYGTQGVPAGTNIPGARFQGASWIDSSGDLWLFGGNGNSTTFGPVGASALNDLWRFDGTNWTWMHGVNVHDDAGSYGAQGVPVASNMPPTRYLATAWTDASGDFWLFGGYHRTATTGGYLNDLWRFDGTNWTWISGTSTLGDAGVYGQQGMPAAGNRPPGRAWATGWVGAQGDFWIFGGGLPGNLRNDLWRFDGSLWTWVAGLTTTGGAGSFGTLGLPATSNVPASRRSGGAWADSDGSLWLFGGQSFPSPLGNDLWRFEPN